MALMKCPECGKEISESAAACPQCGHPIVSSPYSLSPSRVAPKRIGTGPGLALIFIGVMIACWFILKQSNPDRNSSPGKANPNQNSSVGTARAGVLSKSEWRQKCVSSFGNTLGIVPLGQLKQLFGNPQRTQTVGDRTFLYYDCFDGMIQVVVTTATYQTLGNSAYSDEINDY
jgi:DNA-directed RNA polymerase subunit RPC12/RpoP